MNYAKRKEKEAANTDESDTDNELNTDAESNSNGSSDDDMMHMMAMIVRGFKKMKFRRHRSKENFIKKFSKPIGRKGSRKEKGKTSRQTRWTNQRLSVSTVMGYATMQMKAESQRQAKEVVKHSSHQVRTGWMSLTLMKNKAML